MMILVQPKIVVVLQMVAFHLKTTLKTDTLPFMYECIYEHIRAFFCSMQEKEKTTKGERGKKKNEYHHNYQNVSLYSFLDDTSH